MQKVLIGDNGSSLASPHLSKNATSRKISSVADKFAFCCVHSGVILLHTKDCYCDIHEKNGSLNSAHIDALVVSHRISNENN